MNLFAEVMPFLSAAGLALFVGALLTEAMVLVPMWRTFNHRSSSRYMQRMLIGCTVFCAAHSERNASCGCCCNYILRHGSSTKVLRRLSLPPCIGHSFNVRSVLSARQRQLCRSSITHEALPAELARWASWHWFRTTVGLVALASALLALRGTPSGP